jgi:endonuclease/exonuclease/phosphatase family metal-dependent hydrolase
MPFTLCGLRGIFAISMRTHLVPPKSVAFWCTLALAAVCVAEQSVAAEDAIPLRIMTFNAELLNAPGVTPGNLQKYRFDYARRGHIERVASLIETLNPDILNLCEVTSKQAVDAIVDVLHQKGLTEYQGYHIDSHDTYTALDVALITKYRPDTIEGKQIRTFFSEADDPTYRQSFTFTGRNGRTINGSTSLSRNSMYFITVGGYKLGFLGLHLKSNPEDSYANGKRTGEAEIVRRLVRAEIVPRGYLPIVLGDLNDYDPDVPDRDESRNPATTVIKDIKDFDPDRPGPELVNPASKIVRQADRYSDHWDWNENGAHDSDDVYTMIDHILLAKELMPYVTHVFICHSVSDDVSDHYPVVVDLKLPRMEHGVADARPMTAESAN